MKKQIIGHKTGYIMLALFCAIFGHLIYQYVVETATEVGTKSGTFVEAIAPGHKIGYVPYTQMGQETRFYQSMFFDSCLDYALTEGQMKYRKGLCAVTTKDNKSYVVRISENKRWPTGEMVSLDDIYDTYQKILIKNIWSIPSFSSYGNIAIERRADDLVVTFPQESVDNRIFFTNFILPKKVTNMSFEEYGRRAATEKMGSGCAAIKSKNSDTQSLIFDVSDCTDTNFNNYQLKYISREDTIEEYSYVDMVKGIKTNQEEFVNNKIPSRQFTFVFFNTKSKKITPKIQKELGAYISNNFSKDEKYGDYLLNNRLIFDEFGTNGKNIAEYLATNNPMTKEQFAEMKVESLPQGVSLTKDNRPQYFLESITESKKIKITLDKSYSKIKIIHNTDTAETPQSYNSSTKSFFYSLDPSKKNIKEGLNTYYVKGVRGGKTYDAGQINIFYLTKPSKEADSKKKIRVAYLYHSRMDYVVDRLKSIFGDIKLSDYFHFEGYDNPDKFQGMLLSREYDIVLREVNIGQRTDLTSIFANQSPEVNPSLYTDRDFAVALSKYAKDTKNTSFVSEVKKIYKNKVPAIIIGEAFIPYAIKKDLNTQIKKDAYDYFYDLYRSVYSDISIGKELSIKWADIFNIDNITQFVVSGGEVDRESKTVIDKTKEEEKK